MLPREVYESRRVGVKRYEQWDDAFVRPGVVHDARVDESRTREFRELIRRTTQ